MIGQKLGPFLIEAELGSGAMGLVYLGIYEEKNKPVAIKVISDGQIGKGKALERFKREATILKQFRHPNIVRFIGEGKTRSGTVYYAMEYIKGPTLDKVLSQRDSLPWREVVALGIQLCDALHYAHEHGVVHRDLKPANLMLNESGQLKLTDFGIAKDLDATALTGTGRTLGTATYMAPEQIRGTPDISHKTDLYALGAVFYQMLTGFPPFTGSTAVVLMHAHINEPPKRPSAKVEEIPKVLDDLVVNLMAKAPADRPWDAAAVAQTLRELQEKEARQETIKMVWAEPGTLASMPTRAEIGDPLAKKAAKAKSKKAKKQGDDSKSIRERLEVAGLVAGLLLVALAIGYVVWPPSAGYLYRQAETLMAATEPTEWIRARDEYLEPLDRRFPQHEYKEKTEAWRDRIELRDAERRATVLENANMTGFSKPQNDAEVIFLGTYTESNAAIKIHHEEDAGSLWRKMEKTLTGAGRENRGWVLYARAKAEALDKGIQRRRETVAGLLAKATLPEQLAGTESARRYSIDSLKDLVRRFESYPDVADLVAQARSALPPEETKPTSSDPKTDPTPTKP
jgi:eukaryotic-like serine/threonine-protein kinase